MLKLDHRREPGIVITPIYLSFSYFLQSSHTRPPSKDQFVWFSNFNFNIFCGLILKSLSFIDFYLNWNLIVYIQIEVFIIIYVYV